MACAFAWLRSSASRMPPIHLATLSARRRAFGRIRLAGVSAIFVTGRDETKIAVLVERCVLASAFRYVGLLTDDVTCSGKRP